jgi:hypothetical protein
MHWSARRVVHQMHRFEAELHSLHLLAKEML